MSDDRVECPLCGRRSVAADMTVAEGPIPVCDECGELASVDQLATRQSRLTKAENKRCKRTEDLFDDIQRG